MIFINRKRIMIPRIFQSPEIEKAIEDARYFFLKRSRQSRLQERFDFSPKLWMGARETLDELFYGKCAYCESAVARASFLEVAHFRPVADVIGYYRASTSKSKVPTRGQLSPDGYWWLAYDWENLYPVCVDCSRNKRNQFPVRGKRAEPEARGHSLRSELAFLLDPCLDRPESYLVFDEDGLVRWRKSTSGGGNKALAGEDRGAVTIDLLGLNRTFLVSARRREVRALRMQWKSIASDRVFGPKSQADLEKLIDPARPYSGMCRELVKQWSLSLYERISADSRPRLVEALQDIAPEFADLRKGGEALAVRRIKKKVAQKKHATKKAQPQPVVTADAYIRSIVIENFKSISHMNIQFPAKANGKTGWKVLLGENGTGKSSILQGVALTLMGTEFFREYLRSFRLQPVDLLRKVRGERSAKLASITVELSSGVKVQLELTSKGFKFLSEPSKQLFMRGYGATRLLPRRNAPRMRVRRRLQRKVTNLFDPAQSVFNANDWLASLPRRHFATAALALKDLLNLPKQARLRVDKGRVMVPMNGVVHSLDELSAGYETILVMAADIMAGAMGVVHDLRHAPGIVLLDEIDAHLHPRWKMRIVDSLRRTFSSMQFLVTTHEPLCLRGVEKGEVLALERVGRNITVMDDLPAPKSMRVDQLLTSNMFGLRSTIDPVVDEKLTRYYALLANDPNSLGNKEKVEHDMLRSELAKYEGRLMAGSPQEELLYEALDQYFAKEATLRGEARQKLPDLREETKRRVAELWSRYGGARGVSS